MAEPSALRFLEDLKKNNKRSKRRPASQIRNSDNHIDTTPSKVIRVEVKHSENKDIDGKWTSKKTTQSFNLRHLQVNTLLTQTYSTIFHC